MEYKYLSKEQLKGFEKYKYASVDTSPLSNYVCHPFWDQVVELVPNYVAPNLLTFTGFLLTVLNAAILSYYDYTYCASADAIADCPPIPNWVWILCAFNHFLSHTLDGIDGKQARKTKSSGPLGELMDHGLDSWTTLFIPFCIYSIFGRGPDFSFPPSRVLGIFWAIFATFYISHWEKYNTGLLYLPWSYDVSQFILLIAYIITYLNGYQIWKFYVPFFGIPASQIFEITSHVGSFVLSVPFSIYNVYYAYRREELKQSSFGEMMRPLLPTSILFVIITWWVHSSPSDVLSEDPRVFIILIGTIFSNMACRLIISQMSCTRCDVFNSFLIPLAGLVMGVHYVGMVRENELGLMRLLAFILTLAHIHYGVCIVRQMCDHFQINCFTLKKRTKG